MDAEKLTTALLEKMTAEQDEYRAWLVTQPPEEILNHTSEYTIRQDILMALEGRDLTAPQAEALLASYTSLADIYKDWCNQETGYMDNIRDTIESRADELIRQTEELYKAPIYQYPFDYARDNGELDQYRLSNKANIACTREIDTAIGKYHSGFSFDSKAALQDVMKKFGYDRILFVLAATVLNGEYDGRYSQDNKNWSRTVPVFDRERSLQYSVRSHPVLVNDFVNTARHEYLLSLPLTKEDIKREALNILSKFQNAHAPNSPNGTHYMAQISPDFLARAKTKDTDRLMAMLPFHSLSFSGLNDRKGTFALISKDEDRFQKLILRRPSVRKKLQERPANDALKLSPKDRTTKQER